LGSFLVYGGRDFIWLGGFFFGFLGGGFLIFLGSFFLGILGIFDFLGGVFGECFFGLWEGRGFYFGNRSF